MTRNQKIIIAVFLTAAAILLRLVPHPANITPVVAVGLISGTYLGMRYALIVPLAAMLISDIFIGFYYLPILLSVYGTFAFIGIVGYIFTRKYVAVSTVIASSLFASTLFYLTTNFAVWYFGSLYPPTGAGLLASYTLALPFYRNMLVGDLFYTGLLFIVWQLISYCVTSKIFHAQARSRLYKVPVIMSTARPTARSTNGRSFKNGMVSITPSKP